MKAGGGKQKGNSFENKISKDLSLWFSDNNHSDWFCRSPASGAKATIHHALGRDYSKQAGDIIATDQNGAPLTNLFMIECKHYKDLNLEGLIYGTKAGVPEFWKKLLKECQDHKRLPFFVIRQNRRPVLLGLNEKGLVPFIGIDDLQLAYFPKQDLYIFDFYKFLEKARAFWSKAYEKPIRVKLEF